MVLSHCDKSTDDLEYIWCQSIDFLEALVCLVCLLILGSWGLSQGNRLLRGEWVSPAWTVSTQKNPLNFFGKNNGVFCFLLHINHPLVAPMLMINVSVDIDSWFEFWTSVFFLQCLSVPLICKRISLKRGKRTICKSFDLRIVAPTDVHLGEAFDR